MSNRIPPSIDFYEFLPAGLIIRMMIDDLRPKLDSKNPEIRSDATRLRFCYRVGVPG